MISLLLLLVEPLLHLPASPCCGGDGKLKKSKTEKQRLSLESRSWGFEVTRTVRPKALSLQSLWKRLYLRLRENALASAHGTGQQRNESHDLFLALQIFPYVLVHGCILYERYIYMMVYIIAAVVISAPDWDELRLWVFGV